MSEDLTEQDERRFTLPIVVVHPPAEGFAQGMRAGVLRLDAIIFESLPDPFIGLDYRDGFVGISIPLPKSQSAVPPSGPVTEYNPPENKALHTNPTDNLIFE